VRADPVICGHAHEARQLAEAAIAPTGGFASVHIVTYPLDVLVASNLPLSSSQPAPYSPGITVYRPSPLDCCRGTRRRWRRWKSEAWPGGSREEGGAEGHDEGVAEEGEESGVVLWATEGLGRGDPPRDRKDVNGEAVSGGEV
jgi:hypothetical protein